LGAWGVVDLIARLVAGVGGEDQQQAAIQALRAITFWIRDGKGLTVSSEGKEEEEGEG
jgi:hypothetical protein